MEAEQYQELCRVLTDHGKRCPLMEPCDAVKLIYQNEFGCEHLISKPDAALARLRAEWASTPFDPSAPTVEDIGNGMARVALAAVRLTDDALRTLGRDFLRSAQVRTGRRETFLSKLDALRTLTEEKVFSFTPQELEAYLERYVSEGCGPLSHSPAYRAAYRPAYRVVKRSCSLAALYWDLTQLLERGERSVVAIEGRCAAGKSTLAGRLGQRLDVPVVHMDHFFLRPEQRTKERLARPGENVDHERFREEVLEPLATGEAVTYRPWSCQTGALGEPIALRPSPMVLVEGSYSCHPTLWDGYDRRVFLTVDRSEQLRRIEARDGPSQLQVFREKWIPLEERYFSAFQVEERCDYQLEL